MCAIYPKPSCQPLGILQSSFGHLLFCSDRTVYSNYVHRRGVSASHQNKYPETLILLLLLWTLDNGIWKLYSFDILIFDVLKVQYSALSIEWQVRVGRRRVKTRTQCHNDAFCGAKHQVLPSSLAGRGAVTRIMQLHTGTKCLNWIFIFGYFVTRPSQKHCRCAVTGTLCSPPLMLGSDYSAVFTLWLMYQFITTLPPME